MTALSQRLVRLSMLVPACVASLAFSAPAPAAPGGEVATPYYGRWTVSEERPVFTARGRAYKTIDVAQCGRDFCGVSVDDKGKCGPVLFRFLAKNVRAEELKGHGKWGDQQKNLEIYRYDAAFELYLGDGHDFGGRSASMPKFHADYRRTGNASCKAR